MLRPSRVCSPWYPLLVLVAASSPANGQAAAATVAGFIRDSTGTPVALVQATSSGRRASSDTTGRFTLAELPPGKSSLSLRRLGFAPRDVSLDLVAGRTDSLVVVMALLPRELPGIMSTAPIDHRLLAFHRHRESGAGYYLTRKEIEDKRVTRMSDLMRRVSGTRIISDRNGKTHLRMGRALGSRDCPPDFWVDGMRAAYMTVDDIPIADVEALEIYKGPSVLPPEFNSRLGNPNCGAVVIWTRTPG